MENILKLNLKKEVFERLKNENEHVPELTFETTPFYFSRFTNNKNNTIENVKNDKTLFKQFDKVLFTCLGDSIEFDINEININDNDEFVIKLSNKSIEDEIINEKSIEVEDKPIEVVNEEVNEVSNEVEFQPVEIDGVNEEVNEGVNEISNDEKTHEIIDEIVNQDANEIISNLYEYDNVYCVKGMSFLISKGGKVFGMDNIIPNVNNEHDIRLKLEYKLFNIENLDDELSNYIYNKFVFIYPDGIKIFEDTIEIPIKSVSRLEILKWM